MRATGLFSEVTQGRRQLRVAVLDFHNKPGLVVADHKEIDLALLLVPNVVKIESPQAEIRPPLDRLDRGMVKTIPQ